MSNTKKNFVVLSGLYHILQSSRSLLQSFADVAWCTWIDLTNPAIACGSLATYPGPRAQLSMRVIQVVGYALESLFEEYSFRHCTSQLLHHLSDDCTRLRPAPCQCTVWSISKPALAGFTKYSVFDHRLILEFFLILLF